MTLDEFASRFPKPRKTSSGYQAHCPAHDDKTPSLSLNESESGKLLIKCHAGCETADVLTSAGLTFADLNGGHQPKNSDITYDYCDETGTLLYQVVRTFPKGFRQRRPDGSGGYVWNLLGVKRVVYRLRELQGQTDICIVEGEKDVDGLWSVGIPATTGSGGAGRWSGQVARRADGPAQECWCAKCHRHRRQR